jgi:hypothetical protein
MRPDEGMGDGDAMKDEDIWGVPGSGDHLGDAGVYLSGVVDHGGESPWWGLPVLHEVPDPVGLFREIGATDDFKAWLNRHFRLVSYEGGPEVVLERVAA